MHRHRSQDPRPSEITPEAVYLNRRQLLAGAVAVGLLPSAAFAEDEPTGAALRYTHNTQYSTTEKANSWQDITTYNNYYEFGTDKAEPAVNARGFRSRPWTVTIEGEAEKTGRFDLDDLLKAHPLEERIYRLRCVERWSM